MDVCQDFLKLVLSALMIMKGVKILLPRGRADWGGILFLNHCEPRNFPLVQSCWIDHELSGY